FSGNPPLLDPTSNIRSQYSSPGKDLKLMTKLCRTPRLVYASQNLRNQPGMKYVLWIFVTAILAFSAGESHVFAGQRTIRLRQSRVRFEGRIPLPKSDLAGTL